MKMEKNKRARIQRNQKRKANYFLAKILHSNWHESSNVTIREHNFTGASYAVASVLIAFGAVLGRVGPYQLPVMAFVQIIGYTMNEYIVY